MEQIELYEAPEHRSMPIQKPGRSKQDYGTPKEFISAVEKRWGKLYIDLAASDYNAKAPLYVSVEENSLEQPWHMCPGLCWLNPPFENIGKWVAKCRDEAALGARIIMLVPASIGSEWFANHVYGQARVIGVRPRLAFQGCHVLHPKDHPKAGQRVCSDTCDGCSTYPKDCMLILWGIEEQGFEVWKWK